MKIALTIVTILTSMALGVSIYTLNKIQNSKPLPPLGVCVEIQSESILYVSSVDSAEVHDGVISCARGSYIPVTPAENVRHGA